LPGAAGLDSNATIWCFKRNRTGNGTNLSEQVPQLSYPAYCLYPCHCLSFRCVSRRPRQH
jgi:hypothetical protein